MAIPTAEFSWFRTLPVCVRIMYAGTLYLALEDPVRPFLKFRQ